MTQTAFLPALKRHMQRHWQKHLMLLPCLLILGLFNYVPMVGIVIAFEDYLPIYGFFGSEWVGLSWFSQMFKMNNFITVIWNTLAIAGLKIVSMQVASVLFALLLNELWLKRLRGVIQGAALFPNFISWVVCAGIVGDTFAQEGVINQLIYAVTGDYISFLTNPAWFRAMLIITNVWKDAGYNAVVIMAALAGIDPTLYEAADVDGATRAQKMWHVTLPGVSQIVAMLAILSLGGVLSAGFDQIWNLYNATVRSSSEIIDTYVYRIGVGGGMYSLASAVGLFKSVVGAVLLVTTHAAARKYAGYQIF